MPAYVLSRESYFDSFGPFTRPITRLVVENVAEGSDPPLPLTAEPGDKWLCLLWALLGGRRVGLFGQGPGDIMLATLVRQSGDAVSALATWIKEVRQFYRFGDIEGFFRQGFTLWVVPTPFPPNLAAVLREVSLLQLLSDPGRYVTASGHPMRDLIDPLLDLGAMFWRLRPGHVRLQLDTRFVSTRDLERHLERTAQMTGVDLWPTRPLPPARPT